MRLKTKYQCREQRSNNRQSHPRHLKSPHLPLLTRTYLLLSKFPQLLATNRPVYPLLTRQNLVYRRTPALKNRFRSKILQFLALNRLRPRSTLPASEVEVPASESTEPPPQEDTTLEEPLSAESSSISASEQPAINQQSALQ